MRNLRQPSKVAATVAKPPSSSSRPTNSMGPGQEVQVDIEASASHRSSGRSSSTSKRSISGASSAEQVVTSLQVNSKTADVCAASPAADQVDSTAQAGQQAAIEGGQRNAKKAKAPKRVLDPSGSLYYHWSMVVSVGFLYNFWSLSYRFAFREIDYGSMAAWFALDYSADLIYLVDIVINSRTGYLEDGVLQQNYHKVRHHYLESTLFYLDCLCLLPLDILYLSFGFNSIFRCARLVKIYKFWSYVDRTERHTNYPNVFRTFTLVHYIVVIFHWNACLFHMISKNKIIDIESLYKINNNQCFDILCQYLHAFYWSTLALTTIGDLPRPRTKGEYIYVTVELFFGLFLFASVLGHVANIVTNVSAARKEFQAKLDAVKTFMRMRRVSDELQNKVIRWFDYLWISQQSSDEDKSVACLPDRLKAEIAIHVHLDTLKRVDIFQNTEAGFLCELVLRLKPVLFSPGDYVCRKNEVGHEMYIVSRGILEVVTDEGKLVVATLKAGSYFGEISVLNVGLAGNKRTASVRSVGYSDLFCLNKQDLWDVLKNYPNAEARIRARAEERLSKLDINWGQRRRRSASDQQRPTTVAKSKSQWDQPLAATANTATSSRARRGWPANGAKGSPHLGPNNDCCPGRRASNSSDNHHNSNHCCRPECACRGRNDNDYDSNGIGIGIGVDIECDSDGQPRPRMPFIGCHKSRASPNAAAQCLRRPRLLHSSGWPQKERPCLVCIHRNDGHRARAHLDSEPGQVPMAAAARCRLLNCCHGRRPHEPLSYSRSFDQARGRPNCGQGGSDSQTKPPTGAADTSDPTIMMTAAAADSDESAPGARNSDHSSPSNIEHDDGRRSIRSSQPTDGAHHHRRHPARYCFARRSSSAEPPLDADSWQHHQPHRLGHASPEAEGCGAGARGHLPEGLARQQHACLAPLDDNCSGCLARQASAKRRLHQQAPALARHGWAPLVEQQCSPGYWIPRHQHQQAATIIQVPVQSVEPDSQQSSSGGLAGERAHSMSAMYLNLVPSASFLAHHQAALLSPGPPSGLLQQATATVQKPVYFELLQAEQQAAAPASARASAQTVARPRAAASFDEAPDTTPSKSSPTEPRETNG